MQRLLKKRSHKAGLPPGTLVHVGERKAEKVKIRILDDDEVQFEEKEAKTIYCRIHFGKRQALGCAVHRGHIQKELAATVQHRQSSLEGSLQ